MPWTACPSCSGSAGTSSSSCGTSWSSINNTSASTGSTCRRCWTGNGNIKTMKVLVLNSGSSTQKSALFELGPESSTDPVAALWLGKLEWQGDQESLHIRNSSKKEIRRKRKAGDRKAWVEAMLEKLWSGP